MSLRLSEFPSPRIAYVADHARVVAALSVPTAVIWCRPEYWLRFSLVVVTLWLTRRRVRDQLLDAAFCAAMVLAAWVGAVGWYPIVPGLAWLAHAVVPGLSAAVLYTVVDGPPPPSRQEGTAYFGRCVFLMTTFGLATATAWEIYEWCARHSFLIGTIYVDYDGTIGDLVLGGIGGGVAGLVLTHRRSSQGSDPSIKVAPGTSSTAF
jgi:hypothetical protein